MFFLVLLMACKETNKVAEIDYRGLQGTTMGTYYKLSYKANKGLIAKEEMDSLLVNLNAALSTYEKHSIISQFNQLGQITLSRKEYLDQYFIEVYERSKYWFQKSDGFFDPTVMPLVNYWGFGYKDKMKVKEVDHAQVARLVKVVDMAKITVLEDKDAYVVMKEKELMELDFSAIAKGYAVDQLGAYLRSKGVQDYLVDIGGEIVAKGVNQKGESWVVGISKPQENASSTDVALLVKLSDVALASSGNYRNFYLSEGQKFSHTINPKTGYSERSKLLGVSILTAECMDADAIATTCMVKGLKLGKAWVEQLKTVEACFIYNDSDTLAMDYSSGFSKYLINQ